MSGISPGARRSRFFGREIAAILLVLSLFAAGFLPSPFLAVSPGPTLSLSDLVAVEGRDSPKTPFYMVTVRAAETSWYSALRAAMDPRVALQDRTTITGAKTPEEYASEMGELMAESRLKATRLAFAAAGARSEDWALDSVSIEDNDVLGPSAGLAFALQLSGILMKEDLAAGLQVAATGVLDDSGRVLAVGGIAQKAIACRNSGMQVFLVPAANAAEASRYAGDIRVIGVGSLDEAIECLRSVARLMP